MQSRRDLLKAAGAGVAGLLYPDTQTTRPTQDTPKTEPDEGMRELLSMFSFYKVLVFREIPYRPGEDETFLVEDFIESLLLKTVQKDAGVPLEGILRTSYIPTEITEEDAYALDQRGLITDVDPKSPLVKAMSDPRNSYLPQLLVREATKHGYRVRNVPNQISSIPVADELADLLESEEVRTDMYRTILANPDLRERLISYHNALMLIEDLRTFERAVFYVDNQSFKIQIPDGLRRDISPSDILTVTLTKPTGKFRRYHQIKEPKVVTATDQGHYIVVFPKSFK